MIWDETESREYCKEQFRDFYEDNSNMSENGTEMNATNVSLQEKMMKGKA